MNQLDDAFRGRVAQGWIAMFLCFACMFLMALVRDAVGNDFSRWAADPGNLGLRVVSVLMTIYIFMPMLVRNVRGHWFRWVAVGIAAFIGFFILAHQVAHALTQSRPFDIVHIFDFSHHLLTLWVVTLTVRWARVEDEMPASLGAGVLASQAVET